MAQIPAAAAASVGSKIATQALSFVAQLGASYLLSRLSAQDGPRLDNLAAAGGEYGVAMPRAYGEKYRLTGAFIAQADIKETKHTVGDGGLAIIAGAVSGAAQGFMIGGPIGAGIGAVVGGLLGFAAPKQHYYTYSDSFALLLCDRTGEQPIEGVSKLWAAGNLLFNVAHTGPATVTLDAGGKLIKAVYPKNRWYTSLTVYGGSTAQTVDPTLSSLVGETSAYPFTAYIVIRDLQLAKFGNSVPAVEALVSVATGQSLADVAELVAGAAGIDPVRDLSSTALADRIVRGFAVTSEANCWDALKPLLPAFGADCAEVAGQLRFTRRSQSLRATIPLADMGEHAAGDSPPTQFTFDRSADVALPREASLSFVDPARDYLANSAAARRSEGDARSNITTSIPLVLTADEGAATAATMLWDAWLGRISLGFALGDKWRPDVGLAYAIPLPSADGAQFGPYRISRAARGVNGVTEYEAQSDETVTYSASVTHSSGTLPDDESTLFADTRLILIDGPILEDAHDDYGFYVVMGGSEAYWDRGAVQASSDGAAFATIVDQPLSSIMGDVAGTLAAGPTDGLDDTIDTTSVLTVVLLHDAMELASAIDAELDAFGNFGFVGKDGLGEYVQWKTATRVGVATWELTDLRRGRKGTDWAIGTHGPGEEFAVLGGADGAGRFRIVYSNDSQWGVPLTFRGVTLHQDEADADTEAFTNTGEGKRPYSPVNVEGDWDGSHNLDITWVYRSRLNSGVNGIDDRDEYEVEITSGTGRTMMATAVETVTYTAAQQVTDGVVAGETVTGRVRQTSDVNDGRWRDFTIPGPLSLTFDWTGDTFDADTITWDFG